jgi:DNA polymerase (family X)
VAEAEAEALERYLQQGLDNGLVAVAGSYRRRRDTVGDLDILVAARDGAAAGERLTKYENVASVLVHGPTRTAVSLRSGMQVDLRVAPEESYGAALMYFTGSKAHNIALRSLANERGWKLNEYGLFEGTRRVAGATEEEIYKKLNLAFVPPELREDRGEVALAKKGWLPKLLSLPDIRGDLHVHSHWSDGSAPMAEMAARQCSRPRKNKRSIRRLFSIYTASTKPSLGRTVSRWTRCCLSRKPHRSLASSRCARASCI